MFVAGRAGVALLPAVVDARGVVAQVQERRERAVDLPAALGKARVLRLDQILRRKGIITRDYTPFLLILQGMALQLQEITLRPF